MCRGVIARLMSMPPKVAQAGLIPALYQATQITYLPRVEKVSGNVILDSSSAVYLGSIAIPVYAFLA